MCACVCVRVCVCACVCRTDALGQHGGPLRGVPADDTAVSLVGFVAGLTGELSTATEPQPLLVQVRHITVVDTHDVVTLDI